MSEATTISLSDTTFKHNWEDPHLEKLFNTVVKKHKLRVFYDQDSPDQCSVSGRDIWIGDHDDEEYMLLGIMHEIGHIICPWRFRVISGFDTYLIELKCWMLGIEEALRYGVKFQDTAIDRALRECLGSYKGHDFREIRNYQFRRTVKPWRKQYIRFLFLLVLKKVPCAAFLESCWQVIKLVLSDIVRLVKVSWGGSNDGQT